MHVTFIASAPRFKRGLRTTAPLFRNVDLYPLLAHLLNIKPVPTDGRLSRTKLVRK